MKVKMVNSVGEYVAGEEYEIEDEEAIRFVVLGWAEGDLPREVTDEEREALRGDNQEVSV